ncbi:PaaX family transcriptional regulator [Klenkia marina]|uniref:PaaX family transcriptional regulator n=1 Tax=Klenkia marina TaxID=1960309 RepID=UPI000B81B517|nr:PaaX family transcriptional regulator C-terminal domain-containing protein [Klenkia marina]
MDDVEQRAEPGERDTGEPVGPPGDVALRPESLLLTFYGAHVLDRGLLVATPGLVDVMARLGASEHATRSAITRMVRRGRLVGHKRGRQVYLGLTPFSVAALRAGYTRIWQPDATADAQWDGTWTLLSFNLPDTWQRQRHELRTRLQGAGFGLLQGGLWAAPGALDVTAALGDLEAAAHVRAFTAHPTGGLDPAALLGEVWDVPAAAAAYAAFLERWDGGSSATRWTDPLARKLALQEEWRLTLRDTPRLPLELLPDPWPGLAAQELFTREHARIAPAAHAAADALLDTIPEP